MKALIIIGALLASASNASAQYSPGSDYGGYGRPQAPPPPPPNQFGETPPRYPNYYGGYTVPPQQHPYAPHSHYPHATVDPDGQPHFPTVPPHQDSHGGGYNPYYGPQR